ncbi:MAG: GAF domain-containing protein [Anaerolineales bacterium]
MLKNSSSLPEDKNGMQAAPADTASRQKNIALWTAGIFILLGVAFFIYDVIIVFINQNGRFDLSDKVLMPVTVLMFLVAGASLLLIQRNRFSLATGLLYYYDVLIPPIVAILLLTGILAIVIVYIVLLASVLIIWVLPAASRRSAIVAAVLAVAVSLGIEYWNPVFRMGTGLQNFGFVITGLAAVAVVAISIRQFPSLSLRLKIIMALVGSIVVTVAILASYLLNQAYQTAYTTTEAQITTLNQEHILSIQTFLEEHSQDVIILSQLPDLNTLIAAEQTGADPAAIATDTENVRKDLQAFYDAHPVYDNVRFIDAKGQEVVKVTSSYISATLQNKATRPFFIEPSKLPAGALYTSPLELEQDLGKIIVPNRPVIRFATPVYYNNKLAGVVVGNILAENFLNILNDPNNHVEVVDPQGYYLYDNQGTNKLFGGPNDLKTGFTLTKDLPDQAAALLSGQPGSFTDQQNIDFYAPITLSGGKTPSWFLVYEEPQSEIYAPAVKTLTTSLFILAAILLVAIAISIYFGNSLTAPVISLTHTAQAAAQGDFSVQSDVSSKDEIGTLASTFNSMTAQLHDLIGSLEQRVAARTRDLAVVAEVGTAAATFQETGRLLQEVVDLTKERFNLYHSHIYLLDESGENLVLASGAGQAGRQMVAEKRSIPLKTEQSLVARAARERKGVTVNDVTQAPDFLPNPLLPETRSELAVPMIAGGNLIGVFDIQSDLVGRFTESDISIQTTLAAQVAVSIQNVRSFENARTQAELESNVNAIGLKIQRAGSLEETLQIAIREIGTALGASRVSAKIQSSQISEVDHA